MITIYGCVDNTGRFVYVGQTSDLQRRIYQHFSHSGCRKFHNYLMKYPDKATFVYLGIASTRKASNIIERAMIKHYKTHSSEGGCNLSWGGDELAPVETCRENGRKNGRLYGGVGGRITAFRLSNLLRNHDDVYKLKEIGHTHQSIADIYHCSLIAVDRFFRRCREGTCLVCGNN